MKFYAFVGVILCHQIIRCSSTNDLTKTKIKENLPIEFPDTIIEKILHQLGTKQTNPVNVTQIRTKLGYSKQAVQAAASILKTQHLYFVAEKILVLRSKIDDAFDIVNDNIISLERSFNGTVCIGDVGVNDVRNALHVFIDLCAALNNGLGSGGNVMLDSDAIKILNEMVASSTYCLSSAIKTFLTSVLHLQKKVVDINSIDAVQAIGESVLSIVDIVLRGLKETKGHEEVFDNPDLTLLVSAIKNGITTRTGQSIANVNLQGDIVPSLGVVSENTKTSMVNLPLVMDGNIAILLKYILTPQERIPEFNTTAGPIKTLQSHLKELSVAAHSLYQKDGLTAYSIDTSSQNLVATIAYLTHSVGVLPSSFIYIREFHDLIEPNLQANLLFITSYIQTFAHELTLFVEQRLINVICSSSSIDKGNLRISSLELQLSFEGIISTFEKVVRSSIATVQSFMYCVHNIIEHNDLVQHDIYAQTLFRNTRYLLSDLDYILSGKTSTYSSEPSNAFRISTKAFDEAVQMPVKMRAFLTKSVKQIQRYLL